MKAVVDRLGDSSKLDLGTSLTEGVRKNWKDCLGGLFLTSTDSV